MFIYSVLFLMFIFLYFQRLVSVSPILKKVHLAKLRFLVDFYY